MSIFDIYTSGRSMHRREPELSRVPFILRHLFIAWVSLFLGALISFTLVESIDGGGFKESIQALWIPVTVITFYCLWHSRPVHGSLWLASPLIIIISLLLGWPNVMLLNGILPSRGEAVFEGIVTSKMVVSHKRRSRVSYSYSVIICNEADQRKVTLSTLETQYNQLSTGDRIRRRYKIGAFGFLYRWRLGNASKAIEVL